MERNKGIKAKIKEDNRKIFALLSNYLNHAPDFIEKEEMKVKLLSKELVGKVQSKDYLQEEQWGKCLSKHQH